MTNKEKLSEILTDELGIDLTNPNYMDTPKRILKVWQEFNGNSAADYSKPLETTFPAEGFDGILIVKDIRISALCIHHFLPFESLITIAVKLKDKVPGLSKYGRTIQLLGNRICMQENISAMCMSALIEKLNPTAALVYMKSIHTCIACRGINVGMNSPTITLQTHGEFNRPNVLNSVIQLIV